MANHPIVAFMQQARKIEKMIAAIASGETEHEDIPKVSKAINALDDKTNKPEIRGDEEIRTKAWEVISRLRRMKAEAEETGFHARRARRDAEIAGITEKERERKANMTPRERETYNYQQELKRTFGR